MRGSAAFRAAVAPGGVLAGPWVRNELWRRARAVPSLDLRFADNESLVDATTGQNLVTFTRAGSGTYVGSDGLIKTATTNLALRSEEFDNASWSKTTSSVTANAIVAPDGATTADKLIVDNGQSAGYAAQSTSFTSGTTWIASCYAKAGEVGDFRFVFESAAFGSNLNAVFNLSTGVVTSFTTGSASIQSVGNDWYRCIATATTTATASASIQFRSVHAGNGTNGIFLWGAQLEQSSTVGEYIPTTSTINSAPRFDHNPTTGESLGLLVEEQRTNLLLQSEGFSTTWTPTNTTVSTNQIVAPDGLTTADKIVEAATTTEHSIRQDTASQSTGTYTISIFAKAGERSNLQFVSTGVLGGFRANFDLANGVLGSVDAPLTASIRPYPNGWYRCIVTATSSTSGALRAQWNIVTSSTAARVESYAGDITKGLFLWGCVVEAGAFPTSYIPTTTAAVTRSADVASISGSNFSGWYRQDEGTVFISARTNATHGGVNGFPRIYAISDGTNDNVIQNYYRVLSGYTDAGYGVTTLTVAQASFDTNNERNGQSLSTVYANNDFAFVINGSLVSTDNTGTVPTVSQLRLGARGTGLNPLNGTIRRLTYWPQRLPNETLQAVTQ
jgi:hypothetical protein